MEPLYRGFDGLDVSFKGQINHKLCAALESAKEKAQQQHRSYPLEWKGLTLLVAESGARGGYAFLASTGPFGGTWFFKKPNARDAWGVRVSCNSFQLAMHGLGKTRVELYRCLNELEIAVPLGEESIGRVDYAIDFLAPDLELFPDRFVMHSHANRADHFEAPEIVANGRSGRVTSVTVGSMPGRQVIVYDKRAEIIAKHKVAWWEIWDAARIAAGLPPLNRHIADQSRVWRVELRAGKRQLKDRWNIRTWSDLDLKLGDLLATTIEAIRYTQPTVDSNRSRWPDSELWNGVRRELNADLFEMRNYAAPDLIKRVQREAHNGLLTRQMIGLLITQAAISGIQIGNVAGFAKSAGQHMADEILHRLSHYEGKLSLASRRYSVHT